MPSHVTKKNAFQKVSFIIRNEGFLVLLIRVLQKAESQIQKRSTNKHKISFLASYDDVLNARWAEAPYVKPTSKKKPPFTFNWVMSPPRSGGGHQNIFRFIQYLESKGHTCRVYLYSTSDFLSVQEVQINLAKSGIDTKATIEWLEGDMQPADAVFATGWETAYPILNDPIAAQKFYFVQDFEPYFYPVGSEYILAENTYRFNFHGITAGGWLSEKLSKDYGMKCDYYDFGAEPDLYSFTNNKHRKEVFFYARPVTTRRGFELGIMALELFHKQRPEYAINLAGWDVSDYHIPFPYNNLKTLPLSELSTLYNRCAAALVVSLTNMSLLPLELLACGTIPVVNDAPNNRLVSDNSFINYAEPSPAALAQALVDTVSKRDLPSYARQASKSIAADGWSKSLKKFETIVTRELT